MSTYNLHYASCQQAYGAPSSSIYNIEVEENCLPESNLIKKISKKIASKIDKLEGCFEDDFAIRLNEWRDIKEIAEYAKEVMPIIEKELFSCYLKVEFVHPYRNKIGGKEETSWVWHYDDCPKEFIKLFVNLTEVTEDNGCLEYMVDKNNEPIIIESYRSSPFWGANRTQVYPKSRVPPAEIDRFIEEGGHIEKLTGAPGTHIVFTPNVIHRATIPQKETTPRDAIVFFIRPTLKKQEQYINENTNSYLPERNVKQYELN